MVEAVQSSEPGTFERIQDKSGMHFKEVESPPKTGQAYIEPERAKTKRELELEAGKKRVADNATLIANRPPRIISDKERMATGQNVPVFRPAMLGVDRMSSGLGPALRKVGSAVKQG